MPEILERGDIYFAYRPRVDKFQVHGFKDIQRLYLILKPRPAGRYRLLIIGHKQLPEVENGARRPYWGFVENVFQTPEELERDLRGAGDQPAARAAGEGVYAIASHEGHTHLAYALELPEQLGEVQAALHIEKEGSYLLSIKNPEQRSRAGVGLAPEQRAHFPEELQRRFEGRNFIDADPPRLLDYPGAEVLLIGAAEDVSQELGIELYPEHETAATADVFTELRLDRQQHPVEPLLRGVWR
ncbi:MAG: hypothetical protein HY689_05980 [Chloroflexi bacterium]|nr:hypothetical protein [Chloroflexota bacterium]